MGAFLWGKVTRLLAGKLKPNTKGVHCEVESEGGCRQISGLTNRNRMRLTDVDKAVQSFQHISSITPSHKRCQMDSSCQVIPA